MDFSLKPPFIVDELLEFSEAIVIPDFLTFTRYQARKILPWLYFVTLFMLGCYWKNSGYTVTSLNIWSLSTVLSLILFNFISELKSYLTYKCVIKNVDFSQLIDKPVPRYEALLTQPAIASAASWLLFILLSKACQLVLKDDFAFLAIGCLAPVLMYLVFRFVSVSYGKQVINAGLGTTRSRTLSAYVFGHLAITLLLSCLIISPLRSQGDFSLEQGFFSARLMVSMLILCAIVLAINLIFIRPSRRYVFLGRMFQKALAQDFSPSVPFQSIFEKPLWFRLMMMLIVESLWIITISMLLAPLGWHLFFEAYYLVCMLPLAGYFYLHVYLLWHQDYLMACDMCLRWGEIDKQASLW